MTVLTPEEFTKFVYSQKEAYGVTNMSDENFATYMKEFVIANELNKVHGTDYEPSKNSKLKAIDLLSKSNLNPVVQSKAATEGDTYRSGGDRKLCKIIDDAMNEDENAILAVGSFYQGVLSELETIPFVKIPPHKFNKYSISIAEIRQFNKVA